MDDAVIYRGGNGWQRSRYAFMAEYLARRGVQRFGRSAGGNSYRHLLVEDDAVHNFLGDEAILAAVRRRFGSHKAGDLARALTNTTASTPLAPVENSFLWKEDGVDLEPAVRALLTPSGIAAFRRLELRHDFVDVLGGLVGRGAQSDWLARVAERYVPS